MNHFDCMIQLRPNLIKPLKVSTNSPQKIRKMYPFKWSRSIYVFPKHTKYKKTINSILRSFLNQIEFAHGFIQCKTMTAASAVKKQWLYGITVEEMAEEINKAWVEFETYIVNYEPAIFMAAMLDDIPNIVCKWDLNSNVLQTLKVNILPRILPKGPYGPVSKYLALKEGMLEIGYSMSEWYGINYRDYTKIQVPIGNPECFKMVKSYLMSPYKMSTGWYLNAEGYL